MEKKIQGDYDLNLRFADDRVFLNFFDLLKGNDVPCQIKDGKIFVFIYTNKEVEQAESDQVDIDVFKQKEITLAEFIERIKQSISSQ